MARWLHFLEDPRGAQAHDEQERAAERDTKERCSEERPSFCRDQVTRLTTQAWGSLHMTAEPASEIAV